MLLFGLVIASYRVFKTKIGWGQGAFSAAPVGSLAMGSTSYPSSGVLLSDSDGGGERLMKWVTRIFIAIVLQCAALFLISQYPGVQSPFWLGIVLQGYTFVSAGLFYISGGDDPTG